MERYVIFFFNLFTFLIFFPDYIAELPESYQWCAGDLANKMISCFGSKLKKDWDSLLKDANGRDITYDADEHFYPFSNASTEYIFGQMRYVLKSQFHLSFFI